MRMDVSGQGLPLIFYTIPSKLLAGGGKSLATRAAGLVREHSPPISPSSARTWGGPDVTAFLVVVIADANKRSLYFIHKFPS